MEDTAAGTELRCGEVAAAESTRHRFFFVDFFSAEWTFSHKEKGTGYFME
ncbi:MAG: hypothetical protein HGA41_04365 [Syntrophaceae bacterium]|nr:hypothetical protein [Syntrophaceae bacterium]